MKKKFIFFTMLLLTLMGGVKLNVLNAEGTETIIIGEGGDVSSTHAPIYNDWTSYALTQTLYLSDEIGVDAGLISSISFNSKVAGGLTRNIAIYLKNTDKDHYTGTKDWVVLTSEDEPVFEGEIVTPTTTGWYTIQFETPFEYTGGNLAVTINDKTGTYTSSKHDEWWAYSTGGDDAAKRTLYVTGWSSIDYLNLSASTGSYDYVNQGTWNAPVYVYKNPQVKLTITAAEAGVEVEPSEIALGETMLGNYWMENKPSQEVSIKTISTSVTNVTSSNPFFTVPNDIDFTTNPVVFNVGYDVNETADEKAGVLTITYGDGETETVNMTATAYTPGEGDVWELAKKVTAYPYEETPDYANIHANYNLPGNGDAGKDVVYELNFTGDVLLTASVEGANAKLAVYQEGFGGQGGPKADNNYEGLQNDNGGGSSAPTTFGPYTFTTDGTELTNNFVNSGWVHHAYGNDYIYTSTLNSYIITNTPFSITNDSKLTFTHKNVYDNNSGEGYNVFISTDNEYGNADDIIVEECHVTATSEYKEVHLSGYAGKEYYIGLSYTNKTNMLGIDNLALTDGSAKSRSVAQTRADENQIEGVQFSEGKYYLVASATEAFTVNISTDEVPAPAEFALTAPENNATEQNNPKLAWEAAQYALSYNVYIGTSSDLLDAEPVVVTTNSYKTEDLSYNTKYYWKVEAVNAQGKTETTSGTWSFVTPLDVPQNISANPTQIYEGESTEISWSAPEHTDDFLYYNIYVNGELLEEELKGTSYVIQDLDHNITGHEISVTAVYDGLGESGHAKCNVKVCGYGDLSITVKDGETPIKGAAVVLNGTDEFGNAAEYTGSTNEAGVLVKNVKAGEYTVAVSKFGYEEKVVTGIVVESGTPYEVTISMQEKPTAPENLLKDVAVEEDYFDGTAIVTWTGANDNTQMYNIYRRNVESGDVELVAEDQNTLYNINDSYTDAAYAGLDDGTYQYGVTTDFKSGDEELLKEIFTQNPVTYSGWTQTYNSSSYYWRFVNNVFYYYNANYGYKYINAYSGQSAFLVNSNYNTSPSSESTLVTKTLDLTGVSSPSLNFYYNNVSYKNFSNPIYVEVQVVGESTWSELKELSGTTNGWVNSGNIDLQSYSNKQIKIRFRSAVNNSSVIGIDDVIVSKPIYSESAPVWSNTIKKGGIVFTNAAGDKDWNNTANWSTGEVPANDGTAEVTIKGSAVISSDVNVKYLAISGGALTINSGATLTVTGELVNNDEYNLTINDGAQVFHNSENVKARFAMDIVAPTTWSSENTDGWQFIAAPFVNNTAPIANFTSLNSSTIVYDLYKYNGVNAGAEWDNQKDNSNTWGYYFENGVGYLASYPEARTAYLSGTLNNASSHTWNFTYNNDEQPLANFHLLGNPFTFNMDMTKAEFTNLVKGVAIVNNEGGYSYDVDIIPVGDGFFVKAIEPAIGTEPASLSYGVRGAKSEKANSLNVIATSNAGNDNVVINFAGKSEGFNKLQNFNDAIATVYVAEDGKNYGIYNCDADVQEVELYFNANKMGNYTISIEPNGEFETVTLVDRFTGVETNMLLEDYNFTAMSSDNHNRFIVRMVNGQQTTDNSHFVYQSGEELILNIQGDVQIVDVLGRVVYNGEAMNDINHINVSSFNSGAYMVRVMNGNDVKVEKIIL